MATFPDDAAALTARLRECARQLADMGVAIDPELPPDALLVRLREAVLADLTRCREQVAAARRAEDALRASEARYRALFTNMTEAFALGEAIFDAAGRPVNFRFMEINDAFCGQTGLTRDVVGMPITEVLPQVESSWVERYGTVALTGEPVRFTDYNRDTDRYYDVYCYRPEPGKFAILFRDVTRERHIEEALRESEKRLKRAQEIAHLGSWELDLAANRLTWSDEVYRIFGLRPQEFSATYEAFLARIHPDDRAAVDAAYTDSVREGLDGYEIEHRVVRKDTGEIRYVQEKCRHERAADGSVIRSLGMVLDITERKQAEEALRESEARFRQLADAMPQLVWTAEPDGRVDYYNQRRQEYAGITPTERDSYEWGPVLHPDDLEATVEAWQRALATGETYQIEHRVRMASGGYRWHLSRGVPVRNAKGRIVKWYGTATDIEDVKTAQQELEQLTASLEQRVQERTAQLQAALARFEGLLESAPDGIVIVDASGVITLVNSQLERLTGYQRDDILGKPVEMLIPERFRPVHVQHRAGYMTAPRTRPMGVGLDLYLRCKDGREVPVEISLSPFTTPEGLLVMASIRDITARKQAEEEITRLNTALRRNVEQLSVTNKELEAFSYSVSHDLRAPLRGIDGFSKILLAEYSGQLDETARDYLRRVRVAAQRMGRLIDDMLNLSRIGRREMQPAPVDVSALAAEVLAELRQAEPERAVTVIIAPEMTAVGDANLLRIVLENLLGNAWKFTGGRADARIEMGTLEEAGQTVYYIRDNGAGFDMAFADKLFTPFQRLHSEEEFSGTGIGLAIVQRIIARHGGRVWAEGAEGKGATFYFTVGEMVEEAA